MYLWLKKIVFSAGVGRTGVFITLSIVLERMQYEGVVDVFQTARILRTQRPAMVQTEVNFYDYVSDILKQNLSIIKIKRIQ